MALFSMPFVSDIEEVKENLDQDLLRSSELF